MESVSVQQRQMHPVQKLGDIISIVQPVSKTTKEDIVLEEFTQESRHTPQLFSKPANSEYWDENEDQNAQFLETFEPAMCSSRNDSLNIQIDFYKELQFINTLGEGAFGVVDRCLYTPIPEKCPRGEEPCPRYVAVKHLKDTVGAIATDSSGNGYSLSSGPGVKPLLDGDIKAFVNEVFLHSKLKHSNVVGFVGYGIREASDAKASLFLVEEYLPHKLSHMMSENKSMKQALQWSLDIAKGIRYIHSASPPIMHRDLKPDNILLDDKLTAKLTDFGLFTTKAGIPEDFVKLKPDFVLPKNSVSEMNLQGKMTRDQSGVSIQEDSSLRPGQKSIKVLRNLESFGSSKDEDNWSASQTRPLQISPMYQVAKPTNAAFRGLRRFPLLGCFFGARLSSQHWRLRSLPISESDEEPSITDATTAAGWDDEPSVVNKALLTGKTGSLKYMAPENYNGDPYDEKVDQYSFALIMFALLNRKEAYSDSHFSTQQIAFWAAEKGFRPTMKKHWPSEITNLIQECWHHSPRRRPSFEIIVQRLKAILANIELIKLLDGHVQQKASRCCILA